MYFVQALRPEHRQFVIDIDLKCFDHPWSAGNWKQYFESKSYQTYVVTDGPRPIGFCIAWQGCSLCIRKIAVLTEHRRKRVGSTLIASMVGSVLADGGDELTTFVPEPLAYAGVGAFLNSNQFLAETPLIRNSFIDSGEPCEAVPFRRRLCKSTKPHLSASAGKTFAATDSQLCSSTSQM